MSYLVAVPFLIFISFATRGINWPYVGPNATNFNLLSLIARNYLKFGWQTKLLPIYQPTNSLQNGLNLYLNHPQFFPIYQSIMFRSFGESYSVGRWSVILPSMISLLLLYRIAIGMFDKRTALLTVLSATLIPAFVVFSRMISYEPLVMMFVLLAILLTQLYIKSRNKYYLLVILLVVILGTFTDWPMLIFALLMGLYYWYTVKKKESIAIIITALFSEASFLLYAAYFSSGLSGLYVAILNRSLGGQLLNLKFWPVVWFTTLFVRFNFYFNSVFILFSLMFLVKLYLDIKKKRTFSTNTFIISSLFLLGFLNIIIFPEGSFSHAYWIYYFVPFFALASGYYLRKLLNINRSVTLLLILVLFGYMVLVENIKTLQIRSNLWRHDLAYRIAESLIRGEPVMLNKGSVIDADMLEYQFSIPVVIDKEDNDTEISDTKKYIYSCYEYCAADNTRLNELLNRYDREVFISNKAQVYLFDTSEIRKRPRQSSLVSVDLTPLPSSYQTFRAYYSKMKDLLKTPQI